MATRAETMQRYNLPKSGSVVIFTAVPGASYASRGERYRVGWGPNGQHVDLRNIERSGGTFDSFSAWQYAEWRYADTDELPDCGRCAPLGRAAHQGRNPHVSCDACKCEVATWRADREEARP